MDSRKASFLIMNELSCTTRENTEKLVLILQMTIKAEVIDITIQLAILITKGKYALEMVSGYSCCEIL